MKLTAQKYVCGFMFDATGRRVLLIRKTKKDWQYNLYNGLGGKIEPNETPQQAMVREFGEEAGIITHAEDWSLSTVLRGPNAVVYVFCSFKLGRFSSRTISEGIVLVRTVKSLNYKQCVPNLQWLVPLMLTESHECKVVIYPGEECFSSLVN